MSSLRTITVSTSVELVTEECCACGVLFAITVEFQQRRQNDHVWFYCPSGHAQQYSGKTDAQKARERAAEAERETERLRRQLANRDDDLRVERMAHDTTRRERAAARGQVTKIKRRVGRGVCPCCNRTFADLARHMAGQHPEFVDTPATEGATTA